jgi:hypothetical protein
MDTRDWIELSAIATLIECPELAKADYEKAKLAIMDSIRQAYTRGISEICKRP